MRSAGFQRTYLSVLPLILFYVHNFILALQPALRIPIVGGWLYFSNP